jgi:4-hydroxy-tetrahydrodipicolinate synthase
VTGYYNKPTQEGQYRHFMAIADAVDIPIILYNIPARAIVGSRRHHGAAVQAQEYHRGEGRHRQPDSPSLERLACGKDWLMVSGEDGTALGYNAHGGQGCISVTANVAPRCAPSSRRPARRRLCQGARVSGPADAAA